MWREGKIIGRKWRVRMPSEAEWEKAAKGGQQIPEAPVIISPSDRTWENKSDVRPNPNSDRTYPWGNEIERDSANYDETDIGTTSAAGCFSSGASPCGCLDMAGDVGEWTRSLWENDSEVQYEYPYQPDDGRENESVKRDMSRVLRGSPYYGDSDGLRCAVRPWSVPGSRSYFIGFRCMCAPDTSDL